MLPPSIDLETLKTAMLYIGALSLIWKAWTFAKDLKSEITLQRTNCLHTLQENTAKANDLLHEIVGELRAARQQEIIQTIEKK